MVIVTCNMTIRLVPKSVNYSKFDFRTGRFGLAANLGFWRGQQGFWRGPQIHFSQFFSAHEAIFFGVMSFPENLYNFLYPYTIRAIASFLCIFLLSNNWYWVFGIFI